MSQVDFTDGTSEPKDGYRQAWRVEVPLAAAETARVNLAAIELDTGITNITARVGDRELAVTDHGAGLASARIPSALTRTPGASITVVWGYEGPDGPATAETHYVVGRSPSPTYVALSDAGREVVGSVLVRFADLFDTTLGRGNFNFYENYQSTYGIERLAQLAGTTMGLINARMPRPTSYSLNAGGTPPTQWLAVVELGLYIEALRHAIRTYTEQPDIKGSTNIPYADRRDYAQRWRQVLDDALKQYDAAVNDMRRAHIDFFGRAMLVSGGVFGNTGAMLAAHPGSSGRLRAAWLPPYAGY